MGGRRRKGKEEGRLGDNGKVAGDGVVSGVSLTAMYQGQGRVVNCVGQVREEKQRKGLGSCCFFLKFYTH